MAKRSDEKAWNEAEKLYRLSRQQSARARALGLDPRKLPGLRAACGSDGSSPSARSSKRATGNGSVSRPNPIDSAHAAASAGHRRNDASEVAREPTWQAESLACYLANLSDDLDRWLQHGAITPELLARVREELRAIADALETGTTVPEMPEIPLPPDRNRARATPRSAARVRR